MLHPPKKTILGKSHSCHSSIFTHLSFYNCNIYKPVNQISSGISLSLSLSFIPQREQAYISLWWWLVALASVVDAVVSRLACYQNCYSFWCQSQRSKLCTVSFIGKLCFTLVDGYSNGYYSRRSLWVSFTDGFILQQSGKRNETTV